MKNVSLLSTNQQIPAFLKSLNSRASRRFIATLKITFVLLFFHFLLVGCKEEIVDPVEVIPSVNVQLPADPGEVGLVIDVRDLFRKGYIATEAQVTFPSNFSEFNETLEIDPILNTATLYIQNSSLNEARKAEVSSGLVTHIVIRDQQNQVLSEYHDVVFLDDSGEPFRMQTNLLFLAPPVLLKEGIPYYIQTEEVGGQGMFPEEGVLRSTSPLLYVFEEPIASVFNFKYFFRPASDSTYYILRADNTDQVPTYYFYRDPFSTNPALIRVEADQSRAIEFVLEQSSDGWVKIREANTNTYMAITEGTSSTTNHEKALQMLSGSTHRFRFISPEISWEAMDKGTIYQHPIMPPAQIDFAYESTILNCSSGTLTEAVGVTKSRTSTRTMETTESMQLFAGFESSFGFKIGAEVSAKVPAVGQVKGNVEFNANYTFTTNITSSTQNRLASEYGETTEVSRTRTIEILPFTGVEVYDAVRTVKNARTPFTQVVRLTASYTTTGEALSGAEIRTQMMLNFVEGIPVEIGATYVDISLRGEIGIDQMFEVETGAKEILNACE